MVMGKYGSLTETFETLDVLTNIWLSSGLVWLLIIELVDDSCEILEEESSDRVNRLWLKEVGVLSENIEGVERWVRATVPLRKRIEGENY